MSLQTAHRHRHHWQLYAARWMSHLFRPIYFPSLGVLLVLNFTILQYFPLGVKLLIFLTVLLGTLAMPQLTIRLWRMFHGWPVTTLRRRNRRFVPYLIYIAFYLVTAYYLQRMRLPFFVSGIVMAALLIQVACTLVNVWWKVSVHCAGAGGVLGALMVYSLLFRLDMFWWICLGFLIAGVVGTSRMVLRQHTLAQVVVGTLVGIVCGFFGLLMLPNL